MSGRARGTEGARVAREKWESRYRAGDFEPNREPVPFLAAEASKLRPGRALCLAAGAGRNAVFLAELGFAVTAVDIAPAGLAWCRRLAAERGVEVETIAADVLSFDAGVESWDLVTNLYFTSLRSFPLSGRPSEAAATSSSRPMPGRRRNSAGAPATPPTSPTPGDCGWPSPAGRCCALPRG